MDIFTHGKTLDELMDNIKEAVEVSIWNNIPKGKLIEMVKKI